MNFNALGQWSSYFLKKFVTKYIINAYVNQKKLAINKQLDMNIQWSQCCRSEPKTVQQVWKDARAQTTYNIMEAI